jgi:hypothetical protein
MQTFSDRLFVFRAALIARLLSVANELLPDMRRAISVIAEVVGLQVVVISVVIVLLVYGFFISTYNAPNGLNATLTNATPGTAALINNFFITTNSVMGLLVLIPLVVIAGLVIFLIARFGGATSD